MGRKHNIEDRSEEAFAAIQRFWAETGMSPTLREIGKAMKIKSTSLVSFYVDKLEECGKVKRNQNKSRNILIVRPKSPAPVLARPKKIQIISPERNVLDIPNFGSIAAGIPFHLPAVSFKKMTKGFTDQKMVHIPESYLPQGVNPDEVFALTVEGDSMRDAMLTDGDIVILMPVSMDSLIGGEIVAAWIKDTQELTLKRFRRTQRGISLRPENPNYQTLFYQPYEVEIQGKLLAVLRFRY